MTFNKEKLIRSIRVVNTFKDLWVIIKEHIALDTDKFLATSIALDTDKFLATSITLILDHTTI